MTDNELPKSVGLMPSTILVGSGVVGEAILAAHVAASLSVCLVDQEAQSLSRAVDALQLPQEEWDIQHQVFDTKCETPAVSLRHCSDDGLSCSPRILIESIPEKKEIKQAFYAGIEQIVPSDTILCSNTSAFSIQELSKALVRPERFCGMHFFMPVKNRSAVEVIRGERTCDEAFNTACDHVLRLKKQPLPVQDTPGFIVNRLLAPYLNESMRLLCHGVSAERIAEAAQRYGMPMSPLELMDTIGLRTVFDAGRVFWQAFSNRMDPSPLLAGLVKAKRLGVRCGSGVFDYANGERSQQIPPESLAIIKRYHDWGPKYSDDEILEHLSIPMLIEAANAIRGSAVQESSQFNLAMAGGLGYQHTVNDETATWLDFFDDLGSPRILQAMEASPSRSKSMQAEAWFVDALQSNRPSIAMGTRFS